jgi:hypothetical protein
VHDADVGECVDDVGEDAQFGKRGLLDRLGFGGGFSAWAVGSQNVAFSKVYGSIAF